VAVFQTMVKRSVRFPESQSQHLPILQYDRNGDGARAYRALAEELIGMDVPIQTERANDAT
jgi:chromosome partitioning protein